MTRVITHILAISVLVIACPNCPAEPANPVTIADLMRVKNVMDVQVSPDGAHVLCVIAEADFSSNAYQLTLWKASVAKGGLRQMTKGPRDVSPRWSPDGRQIAYLSQNQGKTSLCLLAPETGQLEDQIPLPPKATGLAWSPDGATLAFLAPDENLANEAVKERFVDLRPASLDPERAVLYRADLKVKQCRRLTEHPKGHVANFSWSPDGKQIAFARQPSSRADDNQHTDIDLLNLTTGENRTLVRRNGADTQPKWSPDGSQIAFLSQNGKDGWLRPTFLCVVPAQGGTPRVLSETFDDSTPDAFFCSTDGRSIFFEAERRTTRQLFSLDLNTLCVTPLTRGDHVAQRFSFSCDGRHMAFLIDQPMMPAELYVSGTKSYEPRLIEELNPHLRKRTLGKTSVVSWKSNDGTQVEGLLVMPVGSKPGTRYPLVTFLHGGPAGGFLQGFTPQVRTPVQMEFCPVQLLAGRGYAVFCPNPRGSDGYGQPFRESVFQSWGERDLEDVLSGIDHVVQLGVADPDRLGIMGYCYGAYLSLCALTKTTRFKVASLGASFGDLYGLYGQTDVPSILPGYFGSLPWEAKAVYERHSPIFAAHKITTPVLLHHSEKDKRVPPMQSHQLYAILKKTDTPVDLLIYPRQDHAMHEPRMHAECMRQNVIWLDRWLKGQQ